MKSIETIRSGERLPLLDDERRFFPYLASVADQQAADATSREHGERVAVRAKANTPWPKKPLTGHDVFRGPWHNTEYDPA